jgi:peptide/nickel transport system permease protein
MTPVAAFARRPVNALALAIITALALVAVFAPLLAPLDPADPGPFKVVGDPDDATPRPPSAVAPLGTVTGQLDIYHTLVWGTRSAFVFGLTVSLLAAVIGVAVGAVSGYLGGWASGLLMRFSDALTSIPVFAGVWLIDVLVLGPSLEFAVPAFDVPLTPFQKAAFEFGLSSLLVGLVLFMWMPYARLIYAEVRRLKDAEYVMAARSLGMGGPGILLRHLLPNAIGPALVLLARDIGGVVVLGAAFTFVGVRGGSEWGTLLVISRSWILGAPGNPLLYWWVYIPATVALALFGSSWNLMGDGLNAALNPQTARD